MYILSDEVEIKCYVKTAIVKWLKLEYRKVNMAIIKGMFVQVRMDAIKYKQVPGRCIYYEMLAYNSM